LKGNPLLPGILKSPEGAFVLRFRVAIIALVVGILIGCMGFVLYVSASKAREMIRYFSDLYIGSLLNGVVAEVQAEAWPAVQELDGMGVLVASGGVDETDPTRVGRILAVALRSAESLSWLSVSFVDSGRFVGVNRFAEDDIVLNLSLPESTPEELLQQDDGSFTAFDRGNPNLLRKYDPRERDWFKEAMAAAGRTIWTEPYEFHEGIMGITAARALRDEAGNIVAVGTADFTLEALSALLRDKRVADEGAVALLQQNGKELAQADWSDRLALTAAEVDALLAGVDTSGSGQQHQLIPLDGDIFEVESIHFQAAPGLPLIAAVIIPQSYFLAPVAEILKAMIGIMLLAILVAIALGVWLSLRISGPLTSVGQDLDAISSLTMDDPAERRPDSSILEIAKVQEAVRRMKASLRSLLRYAPREVVLGVVESGQEAILGGEKREVTLLFSDLRGFTRFAESRNPEEVVHFLNEHADRMNEIVIRHEGYVCDFIGDALFAVFGAPEHDPDHPLHAVQAALEMQRSRAELNREARKHGFPTLHLGIGINTGPSIVGNLGAPDRIKYDAIGHAVNIASRIESFAPPDAILISDSTRQLLGDEASVSGPKKISGKGIDVPMKVWQVMSADSSEREMHPVSPARAVRFRRVRGKAVDQDSTACQLLGYSEEEVELSAKEPLDLFATIQLLPVAEDAPVLDLRITDCEAQDTSWRLIGRIASEDAVADRWIAALRNHESFLHHE